MSYEKVHTKFLKLFWELVTIQVIWLFYHIWEGFPLVLKRWALALNISIMYPVLIHQINYCSRHSYTNLLIVCMAPKYQMEWVMSGYGRPIHSGMV